MIKEILQLRKGLLMKKIILIIDDEEILTKTFTKLLERNGYEVYSAKKGQDALCMVEAEPFDLVICDMRMPGMSGVETIREIRKLKSGIPVVFISGFADEQMERDANDLKPIAYMHKPFDITELLELLKRNLK